MRVIEFAITSIGVRGPGLNGWDASAEILRGGQPYKAADTDITAPTILSPLERRRASNTVKLALGVAQEAVERISANPTELPAIFGSSQGESYVTHKLLESLAEPHPIISPTQFHNSVHNTAAGYWSIVVGSHTRYDSLAGGEHTFGATLLKAIADVKIENRPLLMVVFDAPFPEPLNAVYPMGFPFAAALVIEPAAAANPICRVVCSIAGESKPYPTAAKNSEIDKLLKNNPAGRSLTLLEAIAIGKRASISIANATDCAISLDIQPSQAGSSC